MRDNWCGDLVVDVGIRFRLLGEFAVRRDEVAVDIGPARRRHILAAMLIDANTVISADELIDRIWGERPPREAKQVLYSYVSRIRQVLAPVETEVRIVRRTGGYVIVVDEGAVDVHRFHDLVNQARTAPDDTEAESSFNEALSLWRGMALSGLDTFWAETVRDRLDQERISAELDRNELALRHGRAAELLPGLMSSAQAYPLDEVLAAQLMRALHQAGRRAEALNQFERLRDRLNDELAVEPQAATRALHRQILNADAAFEPRQGPAPAQLPADVAGFTGRADELAQLDRLLGAAPSGSSTASVPVVIFTLSGAGGVGKTALALRWVHRRRDRFPDGHLYINLRGYEPEQSVAPAEALAGFLRALGVVGRDIPEKTDQRAALFRTMVDQRRMLVLLDNAGSAEQIRPLLPGSGSTAVIITSRSRLTGLVARDGVHRIELDALPLDDAVELLRDRIGDRAADEPNSVVTLAQRCLRLPLALRVAAEFVVSRHGHAVAAIVDELAEPDRMLDALSPDDDEEAAVRNVFMSSYRNLADASAHAFRSLALYPGESFDAYVVAALTGSDLRAARHWLDSLSQAYMIQFGDAGSFRIHDLLRAFADERCRAELSDAYRVEATTRLLDHYLSTAARAMDYTFPEESVRRPTIVSGPLSFPFSESADARAWLDTHRAVLGTLARLAGDRGLPDHLFKFAGVLSWYLHNCGYYEQAVQLHTSALHVARRLERRSEEAYALLRLGRVRWAQVRFNESFDLLRQALLIFRELGDRWGEVGALGGLGSISRVWGNIEEDLEYQLQTVTLAAEIGDEFGQAMAMENIAFDYSHLGRYDEALRQWYAVDEIWRRTGAVKPHGSVLLCIGLIHIRQGRYDQGQEYFAQAATILMSLNDPSAEAELLNLIGCEAARQGRMEESLAHHRRAMEIHRANNDRFGISMANDGLGVAYLAGQRYHEACEHFEMALRVTRESGLVVGLAGILNNLGEARTGGGEFNLGVVLHSEAHERARQTGDRLEQARALEGLARAYLAAGRDQDARDRWHEALTILTAIGVPPAADVRGRLGEVNARPEATPEARMAGL